MDEPETILDFFTRVRTSSPLGSTGGFLIGDKHMAMRKPGAIGAICGIVAGHGGDVYWVAHVGDTAKAAYGWMEFELAPPVDPCPTCKGSGIDWPTSAATSLCTACPACSGTAERTEPIEPVSAWEHIQGEGKL